MKRALFLGTLLMTCGAMFAQKYLVTDADMKYKEACAQPLKIDQRKLADAWRSIQDAMKNEKTVNFHETYKVAANIRNVQLVQMYQAGQQSGKLDTLAYFNGVKEMYDYYTTYDRLINTPNEKGKTPLKDEELQKAHKEAQKSAMPLRQSMLLGGSSIINSHTKEGLGFLDVYLASLDAPLFKDLNLAETDTMLNAAYLYYGMGLKKLAQTWEDTVKYLGYYEKTIGDPQYGAYSCVELMNTYKHHGDIASWEKYCKYAFEHFPEDQQYPKLLIQEYVNSGREEEALKMCDLMIEKFPNEIFPAETKALIIFNKRDYVQSVELFKKLTEVDPTYGRAWCSLGTSYYQIAMENKNDVKKCKEYLELALPAYKKAEEVEPDDPSLWGYYLYHCYHALNDKTNEAKYKKYENHQ
jgi:tetratricopeptide (TPR) repeat protein